MPLLAIAILCFREVSLEVYWFGGLGVADGTRDQIQVLKYAPLGSDVSAPRIVIQGVFFY